MFAEKTLEILRQFVETQHKGVTLQASKALGLPNDTLNRWLKGERDPSLSKIGPVMDKILWLYSDPEKIERIDIKFPEPTLPRSCKNEIDQLKTELETVKKQLQQKEDELAGLRLIEKKYDALIEKVISREPDVLRKNKSCA